MLEASGAAKSETQTCSTADARVQALEKKLIVNVIEPAAQHFMHRLINWLFVLGQCIG